MKKDFNKLRGKIVEKYGSIKNFLEVSSIKKSTLNNRLQGYTPFTIEEVKEICKLLDVPYSSAYEYFFLTMKFCFTN